MKTIKVISLYYHSVIAFLPKNSTLLSIILTIIIFIIIIFNDCMTKDLINFI